MFGLSDFVVPPDVHGVYCSRLLWEHGFQFFFVLDPKWVVKPEV
jgi:hypothetical protein